MGGDTGPQSVCLNANDLAQIAAIMQVMEKAKIQGVALSTVVTNNQGVELGTIDYDDEDGVTFRAAIV